ncbi:SDR family NAD(P)-dependent oxidoreductase [Mariniphaga sp.]|uniref:SDR family NAD(P)-dependent oxidoreductase n=1 Tax=Mariniphaga sp. TaxID=1954475 RepID=UPI0035642069
MNASPFSLENKTILITGASSGLGAAIATECSKIGAKLIITGRNEDRLNKTFQKLNGQEHVQISIDLIKEEELNYLVKELPKLDGIVLCAGITMTKPIKFISKDNIDEIFQTNIISSMLLMQKLISSKIMNSGSSIVFISSIASSKAYIGNSIYSTSKGAVNSFSKVLALELAPRKIRSNCINPGIIPTEMLFSGTFSDEQLREDEKNYPLRYGEPNDIAYGCIYLLSDASKWVTGSVLTIDGGVTLK